MHLFDRIATGTADLKFLFCFSASSKGATQGSNTSIASLHVKTSPFLDRTSSAGSVSHSSEASSSLRRRQSIGQTIIEMLPNDFTHSPCRSRSAVSAASQKSIPSDKPDLLAGSSSYAVRLPATPAASVSTNNPRVVVVKPTPKPTPQATPHPSPHPTPPATPVTYSGGNSLLSPKSADLIAVPPTIFESPAPTDAPISQFRRRISPDANLARANISPDRDGSSGGSSQQGPSPDSDHLTMSRRKGKEPAKPLPNRKRAQPSMARPQIARRRLSGPDSTSHAVKLGPSKPTAFKPIDPPKRTRTPVAASPTRKAVVAPVSLEDDPSTKPGPSNATLKTTEMLKPSQPPVAVSPARKAVVVPQAFDDDDDDSDFESTDMDEEWEDTEQSTTETSDAIQDREEIRRRERAAARLREEAEAEAARRDLFKKLPTRSYSNLNRTRSGLLTALLNPDPSIFPLDHPYRATASSSDIARQHPNRSQLPQGAQPARRNDFGRPMLQMTKSMAAVPLAANEHASASSSKAKYLPLERTGGLEMEDDSDDPENKIQLSRSVAHEKLAALYGRKTSSTRIQPQPPPTIPQLQTSPQSSRPQINQTRTMPTPIPVDHPWNLPAAQAPSTPRTTRRRMLSQELPESLRRNMLWERQVSKPAKPPIVRRNSNSTVLGGGSALRPLTAAVPPVDAGPPDPEAQAKAAEEQKRRARIARHRSWADDYHYSGW